MQLEVKIEVIVRIDNLENLEMIRKSVSAMPRRAGQADARRASKHVLAVGAVGSRLAPRRLFADAVHGRRTHVAGLHEEGADRAVGGAAGGRWSLSKVEIQTLGGTPGTHPRALPKM